MDEIVDILKEKCMEKPLLQDLDCLLHVDDTFVLSTGRSGFTDKCQILVDTFHAKRMTLNIKKSGYLIINGREQDVKSDLKLSTGWLSYKSKHKYLGSIITDTGKISDDVNLMVKTKSKDVMVKLSNFVYNNKHAPVSVKLKIVKACVNASTSYTCECWGKQFLGFS